MESTIGLYKTELIKPGRPWQTLSQVELVTAEWIDWYCFASDRPPQPTAVISGSVATAPPCALMLDRIWALQYFSQLVPSVSLRVSVGARAA